MQKKYLLAVCWLFISSILHSQTVLSEKCIDDSLTVSDFYYRTFSEINGFILKILKENGRGDGNYAVLDYIDLRDRGFLRREKFKLQYFNNDLQLIWEVNLPPETYISVPKPFYQITANDHYIYFFETGSTSNSTYYTCKLTQINYSGEIVDVSKKIDIASRVFATFPSERGLHLVSHRFLQGPEYYMGTFSRKGLTYYQKKISLPHSSKEITNWTVNKSEFENAGGNALNNYTWLRKGYIIYPMSEDEAIYSRYIQMDTAGNIRKDVKIDFDVTYRNFLGIDTECFIEQDKLLTIVLKGARTGPYFDIYVKKSDGELILNKKLHFYDIMKYLRDEYRYYDYREISYNHYRNVDHFKAIIYDNFNDHFVLIDQVPDGTYFFHVDMNFDIRRIDYAKEFSGVSNSSTYYNIGIINGFSTIYADKSYEHKKTALDYIMSQKHDNPRDYYYTVLNRDDYQLLIIENLQTKKTTALKLTY